MTSERSLDEPEDAESVMQELAGGYTIRELSWEELGPHFQRLRPLVFAEAMEVHATDLLSEPERAASRALQENLREVFALFLGLYRGEEVVGWTLGVQADRERFSMINSAVLPEHRNQGLYTALLRACLEKAEQAGFQVVVSRHHATNSRILVPKLKAGFIITGMELSDTHGLLVTLSYYFNPARRRLAAFRAGEQRPDQELRALLGL